MKKKLLILLTLLFFAPFVVNAYEVKMDWIKNRGGNAYDNVEGRDAILQTSDGGFLTYFASYSTDLEGLPNKGEDDMIIVKHSKDGNAEWKKSWGGNSNDYFSRMLQTEDDGFIAVGSTSSKDIDGIENYGVSAAIIVKYDKDGNVEWQRSWSISSGQRCFNSISITSDGDFLVVGTSNEGRTRHDAVIAKFDKDGNMLWQKYWGGNSNDYFSRMLQTEDDGFIAVGSSISTDIEGLTYLGGYNDVVIVKYDKEGNVLWQKNWGGNGQDELNSISLTLDGGFIAVGGTNSTDIDGIEFFGHYTAIIVKFDKNGNVEWQKSWGGNGSDRFYSILQLKAGGFVAVGKSTSTDIDGLTFKGYYSDAIIVVFDRELNIVYQTMLGGSGATTAIYSIFSTLDGGFITVGESDSTDIEGLGNNGGFDVMIIKYLFEYNIESIVPENGKFTVEQHGSKGIITPETNEGYEVDEIIIEDISGNEIETKKLEDGTYSFPIYDDVKVEVIFKEKLVNPKTGLFNYIGLLLSMLICSFLAFWFIMKKDNKYEL